MELLKEALGEELFEQVGAAIEAYNGDESHKESQVKIANLGSGKYVNKDKYSSELEKLNTAVQGKDVELTDAKAIIEQLQKASEGNEDMKSKIDTYEAENSQLKSELKQVKNDSALKIMLIRGKVADVGYLSYRINEELRQQGKELELDDNGNVKNADELMDGIKKKYPSMFESDAPKGGKNILEKKLEKGGNKEMVGITEKQFRKMSYNERVALKKDNEYLYNYLSGRM